MTGALLTSALAVATSGCGLLAGGDDSAGGSGIAAVLADIPDTPGNRQQLQITDHAALAGAIGVEWPLAGGADAGEEFSEALLASGEVLVPTPLLTQLQDQDGWRRELGFAAGDISVAAESGVPPSVLSVYRVTTEPKAIADAVAADGEWSGDLATTESHGATVYSWGADPQAIDPARRSPVRQLGQGGVLAVTGDDGVVLWATDPATVDGALAARDGDDGAGTLAGDDNFAALARALDQAGCYTAFLSDRVPVLDPFTLLGPRASPAAIEQLQAQLDSTSALPPYLALGIGNAVGAGSGGDNDTGKGQGYIVFTFATASEIEAKAVADAFIEVVAEGTSAANRQPWSSQLTVRDTAVEGSVAVITVDTERPSIGIDAYQRLDTLLAVRAEGSG